MIKEKEEKIEISALEKALNNMKKKQKKCPNCGMLLLNEARYCKNCGLDLNKQ